MITMGMSLSVDFSRGRFTSKVENVLKLGKQHIEEKGRAMGSGSTRPNNADDKMLAAIERGDDGGFKDRNPVKNTDKKLIKAKEAKMEKTQEKTAKLKALRLAAEKEAKAK
jgi:hypothetical protein